MNTLIFNGLGDGDEISTYGTNPLKIDTDRDGSGDGTETLAGTDPLEFSSTPAPPDGDLNLDGQVNIADVVLAQQIVAGIVAPTMEQLAHGNVAPLVGGVPLPDGTFDTGDIVVIQQKALGILTF